MTRRTCLTAALTALVLGGCVSSAARMPLEVFAVRHAEKQSGSDPALTPMGEARAVALADLCDDRGITAVHSSDTRRTRATAAPIAERLGLEVELYDPRDLDALVGRLRARGGTHLVVGHSNTTPDLVARLGGEPGEPIVEATEYDRLYLVAREGAEIRTVVTRFGE